MTKYIKVTMIFEPENGSTLEIEELREAVEHAVMYLAPEPDNALVEVLDTEDDNADL